MYSFLEGDCRVILTLRISAVWGGVVQTPLLQALPKEWHGFHLWSAADGLSWLSVEMKLLWHSISVNDSPGFLCSTATQGILCGHVFSSIFKSPGLAFPLSSGFRYVASMRSQMVPGSMGLVGLR